MRVFIIQTNRILNGTYIHVNLIWQGLRVEIIRPLLGEESFWQLESLNEKESAMSKTKALSFRLDMMDDLLTIKSLCLDFPS